MLDQNLKDQVVSLFSNLKNNYTFEVKVVSSHESKNEFIELLNEVAACSQKVDINISEALTPNGDGINDTWFINNIQNYPNSVIRVYNRWGQEVLYSVGYQNDWNGHFEDKPGSLPDSASYYYQIDLDGNGSLDYEGWLYITK